MELYVTLKREELVRNERIIERTVDGLPMAAAAFFRSVAWSPAA